MHHYHLLQQKLDRHPVGAPYSEKFIEILKLLFPPGEVELALLLDFKLKKVENIVQEIDIPLDEAVAKLEDMADKGAILGKKIGGTRAYALLPNYPGLFEYPLMRSGDPENQTKLGHLWHAYYMEAMAAELGSANPPWMRVLPAEEAIDSEIEILPYEAASQMMAKAKKIAVGNCPCRISEGKCDKPLETCLSFDGAAEFLAERGIARAITLDEAIDILKKTEEAGLVHTGSNNQENLLFICNCCVCCCHMLRLITEHNFPDGVAKSSYIACLEDDLCTGCEICVERCPVGAIACDHDIAELSKDKCIGCGLCVSQCPTDAVTLTKRDTYTITPQTLNSLAKQVVENKRISLEGRIDL